MFKNCRIIELTHALFPGREEYQLEVHNHPVDELLSEYHRPPDAWYIMSSVQMWSHVGTHMEMPFHYLKTGQDCSEIPLWRTVGGAALIDLSDHPMFEPVLAATLEARGQHVRAGDIVLARFGLSHHYRSPRSHDRPHFTTEAIEWLIARKIACLGVDCSGIEKRGEAPSPTTSCCSRMASR